MPAELLMGYQIRFPTWPRTFLSEGLGQRAERQNQLIFGLELRPHVDPVRPEHVVGCQQAPSVEPNFGQCRQTVETEMACLIRVLACVTERGPEPPVVRI